jgi:hypothetical protein
MSPQDSVEQSNNTMQGQDSIIADFSLDNSPGSLRGIALDEVENKLYVTDFGELLCFCEVHSLSS